MAKDNKKIPLREKKKRKTEHCITHSALLLFEEHGYDSVSIDDIAEASEVSKSTFYNYFDSKESVLLKLSVNSVNNVREEMAKLPDQDDPVFMLAISVSNPYRGVIEKKEGRFISSRHKGAGQGIESVRITAEKYSGILEILDDRHIFTARVLLQI